MYKLILPIVLMILSTSCGDGKEQIVSKFFYDIKGNFVDLTVDFDRNIELNTELIVPIKDYGELSILPSTNNQGIQIKADINIEYINDQEILRLRKTRNLPNGQPMSRYVQNEVAQLRIEASEKVAVSAYFGTDSSAMYFGTAVELSFINENFPPGLVLTQRIKDPENRPLGVVTFFGPKLRNDQVIAPGGFFLMTNISDLIKYYNTNMENNSTDWGPLSDGEADFYINEPYRKQFSSPQQRYKLYKTYNKRGKKAGMID